MSAAERVNGTPAGMTPALSEAEIRQRMKITKLTREQSLREWPILHRFLDKAIPHCHGRFEAADLKKKVEANEAILFLLWDPEARDIYAVLCCESHRYPGRSVFSIGVCGGVGMPLWAHLYPVLKQYAMELEYDQIEINGRRGWKRALGDAAPGLKEAAVVLIEEL